MANRFRRQSKRQNRAPTVHHLPRKVSPLITLNDYLKIDGKIVHVDNGLLANAQLTVARVNTFLEHYRALWGITVTIVTSGCRTPEKNRSIPGAARHSKHLN